MKKSILKQSMVVLLVLMLLLSMVGCGVNKETVLTIGVYSGSYWNTPNGNCYQILDEAIAMFEQANPGVKVEYVSGIPAGSYSEWLTEQILKGKEPDLYFVLPEDFDLLVSSGALDSSGVSAGLVSSGASDSTGSSSFSSNSEERTV